MPRMEEKDVSSRGLKSLKEKLLASVKILDGSGAALTVKNVTKADGEVRQLLVRGKPRLGFELALSLQWAVVDGTGASVAAGSVTMEEVTDTDSDIIGSISASCTSCSGGAANPPGWRDAAGCKAAAQKALLPHWRDVVKEWTAELQRA
jgi:hypothetical protein